MIKKWSYVAAAMLTASSGLVLTGCIDNDEPYGIEQIRVATANLLEAKKAAVNAQQAAEQAKVEIAKIEAEIRKLEIEKEKILAEANAKLIEAQAKEAEARAEAERLRAEGQKAKDDAEAAKLLAEAAVQEALADQYKAEAERIRKEAEAAYQKAMQDIADAQQKAANDQREADQKYAEALYWFEKTKADNANTANSELWGQVETAFYAYLAKIDDYNRANKAYQEALNHYAQIEADLVWVQEGTKHEGSFTYPVGKDEETGEIIYETETWSYFATESKFISPNYDKKRYLIQLIGSTKREIAGYQKTIDIYNELVAKLEAFKEGEWPQLLAEYQEKLAAAAVDLEKAKLDKENLKIDQKDVYDAPDQIQAKIDKFEQENVQIDPFTIDPIDELSAINNAWSNPITIVGSGETYKVTDAVQMPQPVTDFEAAYNAWIKKFTMAMFDENDVAWTQAILTELERRAANDEPFKKAKENWEMAKKAYNMGGVPDASVLPLADEVDAAVAEYNAYEDKINEAKENVKKADKDVEDTLEAMNAAQEAYDNGELPGAYATYKVALQAWEDVQTQAAETYAKATGYNPETAQMVGAGTIENEYQLALQKIANEADRLESDFVIKETAAVNAEKAAAAAPADEALQEAAKNARKASDAAYDKYYAYVNGTWTQEGDFVDRKSVV